MFKRCVMLTCVLFFAFAGTLQARPLGSPDIVYIDGLPCNSLCRSYLAWSRDISARSAPHSPKTAARRVMETRGERTKAAAPTRTVKQGVPSVSEMARAKEPQARPGETADLKTADLQPPANPGPRADTTPAKTAPPAEAPQAQKPSAEEPQAKPAPMQTADSQANAAAGGEAATAKTAESHPVAGSDPHAIEAQVAAATAVAEQMTVSAALSKFEQKAEIDAAAAADPSDATPDAAPAKTGPSVGNLVALVMTGEGITSLSDLASKNVAIDDRHAAFNDDVRIKLVAAGAADAQLSQGNIAPINRLISGEVPAAVLALVSPEAAQAFPEIAGYRTFRIPLSPDPEKGRP
jgi:hypothetical protein